MRLTTARERIEREDRSESKKEERGERGGEGERGVGREKRGDTSHLVVEHQQ